MVGSENESAVITLAMKLRARDKLTVEEERALAGAVSDVRSFKAGEVLIRNGQEVHQSTLLIDGIVCRYKDLASGERQIQELHIAGDFVDLHGFLLKRLDHNVGAVSDCRVAIAPHDRLKRITEEEPHLARLLWFSTILDASIQRETILSIGRRDAVSRIAHLMCELSVRLRIVGKSDGMRFALPLTQTDLADATGLTSVHVNRMLRQLREDGLMSYRGGEVVIHDWQGLAAVAEFDPDYLHVEQRPR